MNVNKPHEHQKKDGFAVLFVLVLSTVLGLCELGIIKGGIEAAKVHKFLVSTLFRNGSVLNNEDIIRVLDG